MSLLAWNDMFSVGVLAPWARRSIGVAFTKVLAAIAVQAGGTGVSVQSVAPCKKSALRHLVCGRPAFVAGPGQPERSLRPAISR